MTPFKFGNWLVTEKEIAWDGQPATKYSIERERLLEPGPGDRKNMYDWLVHIPTKGWATEADVYTLNTAFVYAISQYELDFNTFSFVETLIEQQRLLKDK